MRSSGGGYVEEARARPDPKLPLEQGRDPDASFAFREIRVLQGVGAYRLNFRILAP